MLQAFWHGYKYVCFVLTSNVRYSFLFFFSPFFHLHCSTQLSMYSMEKRYRNKNIIIIITIVIITKTCEITGRSAALRPLLCEDSSIFAGSEVEVQPVDEPAKGIGGSPKFPICPKRKGFGCGGNHYCSLQ